MDLEDKAFVAASRLWAGSIMASLDKQPLDQDQAANLVTATLVEVLAQRLGGVFPAVERLRLVADIFEAQAFAELGTTGKPN